MTLVWSIPLSDLHLFSPAPSELCSLDSSISLASIRHWSYYFFTVSSPPSSSLPSYQIKFHPKHQNYPPEQNGDLFTGVHLLPPQLFLRQSGHQPRARMSKAPPGWSLKSPSCITVIVTASCFHPQLPCSSVAPLSWAGETPTCLNPTLRLFLDTVP